MTTSPLTFVCPACRAAVGAPCRDRRRRRSGAQPELRTFHVSRMELAWAVDYPKGEE